MTPPDIAGLCERLRTPKPGVLMDITGFLHPKDRANPDGPEAADTLERQAAEIKRLRGALKRARRYVADLPIVGDADIAIIDAALTGEDTAGSPSSQNTEPGLAFSDAGEP
jgi:hypothetical protein